MDKKDISFQTDNNILEFRMELTSTTGSYLQYLNEDCLLEIFSSSSLTLMDMCSVAETCTRLKAITQRVFPKKFCIECNNCGTYKFITKNSSTVKTREEIERILKNFGHYLHTYSSRGEDAVIMNAVSKYCNDGSLKNLTLCEMDCTADLLVKLKTIFQWLFTLSIRECNVRDDITALTLNFDSLTELNVIVVEGCDAILKKTFPKLERFRFSDAVYVIERGDILAKFIGSHPLLRSLHMDRCYLSSRNDLGDTIGSNCNELVELTLRNVYRHKMPVTFSKISNMKRLKMLHMGIDPTEFDNLFSLLSTLKSIEIVKVSREYSTSNILSLVGVQLINRPILMELKHLRELHLIGCCKSRQLPWAMLSHLRKLYVFDSTCPAELPYIVDQLKNLDELEIGDLKSKLSEEDFAQIVEIFKGRPKVLTVKCRMYLNKNLKNCDENCNVKLINLRV